MKVLVMGATGTVGSLVVHELVKRGVEVRAFARKQPEAGKLPGGVEMALGDLLNPLSVEQAMKGVDKLFLLNAVIPDELTQALIAYGLARRLGLKHIAYLSVYRADHFRDVPHFASKLAVENAIREFGVPYTILRPGYFVQNDQNLRNALTGPGVYPMPVGTEGIAMVDVRDIAEVAVISLTGGGHEGNTYDLVNGELHSGPRAAAIWTRLLGKNITYTGHDFDAFEAQMRGMGSTGWAAYDIRAMFEGFFKRGFAPTQTAVDRVRALLGRELRTYEAYAAELVSKWSTEDKGARALRPD